MNDMSVHFNEGPEYLPGFAGNLTKCLDDWDDVELEDAVEKTWTGFVSDFQHPNASDLWADCLADPEGPNCDRSAYEEG